MLTILSTIDTPNVGDGLPSFAGLREHLIKAEQGAGWLDECDDAGRFVAVSMEMVESLATVLRKLSGSDTVLEVCAGSGELARRLSDRGLRLQATDAAAPADSDVLCMSAGEALIHFRPSVVLGVFVPHDAGVDEAVIACPSVKHYVTVNARLGGTIGSPSLWMTPGWKAEPLDDVSRWVITRHDVWLGQTHSKNNGVLQQGEVWHFSRTAVKSLNEGGPY